jgi:SpoVK/Ycf46/Vps4 family AAA+-type ATPase
MASESARFSTATVWLLRLLLYRGTVDVVYRDGRGLDSSVCATLGKCAEALPQDLPGIKFALQNLLLEAEAATPDPTPFERNVDALVRELGFDAVEKDILHFAHALAEEEGLQQCFEARRPTNMRKLVRHLSHALGHDPTTVEAALHYDGKLRRGVLAVCLSPHFEPLRLVRGLSDALTGVGQVDALAAFANRAPPTTLAMSDFDYERDSAALVVEMLRGALKSGTRGVHVLLHGEPGVGKTAFARVVAHALDAALFEVPDRADEGHSLSREGRLGACGVAQHILAHRPRTLLLFDEAEDVFMSATSHLARVLGDPHDESTHDKSWTHRLLEEAPVPMIWTSNAVDHIDPATRRRFALIVELDAPNATKRRQLIETHLQPYGVREDWITSHAAHEGLTPAEVHRLASIAAHIDRRSPSETEEALSTAFACGGHRWAHVRPTSGETRFDARFLNTSVDVSSLLERIDGRTRGVMCFYGPPGTGKSALARAMAKRAGRPLIAAKLSDVLDMFQGETEKKIAKLFQRAKRSKALLLIDEADALLQDRRLANRLYEVTQAAELLLQLESFDGLAVVTTNLMTSVDRAAMRRFALKVRFDALRREQAWELFTRTAQGDPPSQAVRHELANLRSLTPGDFVAAKRRLALLSDRVSAEALIEALREEVAYKDEGRAVVGFRENGAG